jgi:hypothetical protein
VGDLAIHLPRHHRHWATGKLVCKGFAIEPSATLQRLWLPKGMHRSPKTAGWLWEFLVALGLVAAKSARDKPHKLQQKF